MLSQKNNRYRSFSGHQEIVTKDSFASTSKTKADEQAKASSERSSSAKMTGRKQSSIRHWKGAKGRDGAEMNLQGTQSILPSKVPGRTAFFPHTQAETIHSASQFFSLALV